MQILDHQDKRRLFAQVPEQAEQQLEQSGLGDLVALARTIRCAQGGKQAGQLGPGRADELTYSADADIGEQGPQDLHDRGIRQGAIADRHTATGQHPGPLGGTAGRQLGDKSRLADAGFAPHQDDGRVSIRGPPCGRLEGLEFRDTADEGGARHAAAHLAGIIPRDRPEENGGPTGSVSGMSLTGPHGCEVDLISVV